MSRERILQVVTQLDLGGAQVSTLELLRRLDSDRYEITLVTSSGGALEAHARAIPHLRFETLPYLVHPIRPVQDVRAERWLVAMMRERHIDIVHTHSSKAGILGRWAALRAGVPVICHTVHGFAFHASQPAWQRALYQAAERAVGRVTTRLITVSRFDTAQAIELGMVSPERCVQIPYGIDATRFHRDGLSREAARVRLGLRPEAPTVGTVACFKPQKAPDDFLAVCAKLRQLIPNIQCIMVGDGRLRPRIERRRHALGLDETVHLLGWRRDIPEILTALDVFLLTSRWEGLPLAVLEAQAIGVPVVVTDTGGVRDCLEDGVSGYLVPIGAIDRLSQRVVALLQDGERAHRIAEQARVSVVEHFSAERMAQEVDALYLEALQANRKGGS